MGALASPSFLYPDMWLYRHLRFVTQPTNSDDAVLTTWVAKEDMYPI